MSILTNSQGTGVGVGRENAYPALVRAALEPGEDVQLLPMSGWTIRDFNAHLEAVLLFRPDIVVAQIGIVECSRRIPSAKEKTLFALLPGGRRLTGWLHRRRQRVIRARRRLRVETRLYRATEFRDEVARFVARLIDQGAAVLLLQIPRFPDEYERFHFPYLNEDIDLFNAELEQLGARAWLGDQDVVAPIWQEGTVHFNEAGHAVAAERLLALLRPVLGQLAQRGAAASLPAATVSS